MCLTDLTFGEILDESKRYCWNEVKDTAYSYGITVAYRYQQLPKLFNSVTA